ncbi:hypothetical protein BT96DRAFT_933756 [Gymnopus androsaceus JB14]|uniref:Uncharacterized protein n=1 Tax=Gymnopus androsaceus JB14 TaxID=1447944 RepID=A0A6A4ICI0_9AGAR|nr:hypothetical protein BT96DRAFT_933756 [Gymnopus androsaceus JB14]
MGRVLYSIQLAAESQGEERRSEAVAAERAISRNTTSSDARPALRHTLSEIRSTATTEEENGSELDDNEDEDESFGGSSRLTRTRSVQSINISSYHPPYYWRTPLRDLATGALIYPDSDEEEEEDEYYSSEEQEEGHLSSEEETEQEDEQCEADDSAKSREEEIIRLSGNYSA